MKMINKFDDILFFYYVYKYIYLYIIKFNLNIIYV